MRFTIAIDGPAAAGKGTVSKAVARHFGFAHLDTGALYRAVALKALQGADPVTAAETLMTQELEADALRTQAVAQKASEVAAIPQVRAALLAFQRDFARREGGAVLDGRDIGTVICPDADAKLFVTASAACRADRRYRELLGKGADVTPEGVLADVEARDKRDRERAEAPLIAAEDAVTIDTTDMDVDTAIAAAVEAIRARMT